jgi:putative transposase
MRCIECGAVEVSERPACTSRGYRRFRCRACGKQFNERSGRILNRTRYPSDVIALVVFWRLRYKLSLRDLPEMFLIRGIEFSYEAVRRQRKGRIGRSWYVDETYIKVRGRWCYLYRAIDRAGALVDVRLSETRDMEAAKAFFRSAKTVTGVIPARVTTDGHDSYRRAIRTELNGRVKHRTNQYLNNRIEQDHRGVKGRYGPMRGFKSSQSAARFCGSFDELRNHLHIRSRRSRNLLPNVRRHRFLTRGLSALRILEAA